MASDWKEIEKQIVEERNKAQYFQNEFIKGGIEPNKILASDMDLVDNVAIIWREGLSKVANGEPIDSKKFEDVDTLLLKALSTIIHDNDALKLKILSNLFKFFPDLSFLSQKAKILHDSLKNLDKELKVARKQTKEAYQQAAIDSVITVISGYIIPTSFIFKACKSGIALFISEKVDHALGPEKPKISEYGKISAEGLTQIGETVEELKRLNTIKHPIKIGTRITQFLGFAFDAHEIIIGHQNVGHAQYKIKTLLEDAKKGAHLLDDEVLRTMPSYNHFIRQYQLWQNEIKALRNDAYKSRMDTENFMREINYYSIRF